MKKFSIKESLKFGWSIWKENWRIITIATIVNTLASYFGDFRGGELYTYLQGVIILIISIVINIGWTKLIIKAHDKENLNLNELISHISLFWRYLAASIIFFLCTMIGLVLLIVPGIYFMLRYHFVFLLIVDKNISFGRAFKESAQLMHGVKWKFLGFALACLGVNILGLALAVVGLFVTIPVTTLAYVHIYRKLASASNETSLVA